jgi:hypothetical protein
MVAYDAAREVLRRKKMGKKVLTLRSPLVLTVCVGEITTAPAGG